MPRFRPKRRRLAGFTLVELMAVAAICSAIPSGKYIQVKQRATQSACQHNLRQAGLLITQYHLEHGHYPKAAFFPKDPLQGSDSIRVLVEGKAARPQRTRLPGGVGGQGGALGMIATKSVWVCPALPDALRNKGLTFVYNDDIAGKRTVPNPSKTWVLIEMTCVSEKVPPPHPKGFNILFADGHVINTKHLPKKIKAAHKAELDRLWQEHHHQAMAANYHHD